MHPERFNVQLNSIQDNIPSFLSCFLVPESLVQQGLCRQASPWGILQISRWMGFKTTYSQVAQTARVECCGDEAKNKLHEPSTYG
jgi:hypothetical protein